MLKKLKTYWQIAQNMGWRYTSFRAWYEFKRKTGLLKLAFPTHPPIVKAWRAAEWRLEKLPFFFQSRETLSIPKTPNPKLAYAFEQYQNGYIQFFNASYLNIGRDYDWLTNPDSGFRYDITKHWTEVADFSPTAGDIKFVWEKSRFSFIYTIIRYDYHFQKECSALVFNEIESWIDANPLNQGPNYKCSQEISLRVLNWTFALHYYKNAPSLTDALFQKIQHSIYWQIHHVRQNIHFSRLTVRNNHAITECLMLYLSGLLFPFLPDTKKWSEEGKRWFEQEINYQIYTDGTFLQFSHNYHRVVIQLLTWAFCLSEKKGDRFTPSVYERAKKSLDFLFQNQDISTGYLPNYGNNDGALFFPLSDTDYRNYRPQLNVLYRFFTNKDLYTEGVSGEDAGWFLGNSEDRHAFDTNFDLKHRSTSIYTEGGVYVIRDAEDDSLTTIRCGNHRDRPAQADNLHLDIWVKGENILRDSGTYKYNTSPDLINYFAGTSGHNTVMLGTESQMLKGPRFIWLNWTQALYGDVRDLPDAFEFEGEIKAFAHISPNIRHRRRVRKEKGKLCWTVEDSFVGSKNLPLRQIWHISPTFDQNFVFDKQSTIHHTRQSAWYSSFYGIKEPSEQLIFESEEPVLTTHIRHKQL